MTHTTNRPCRGLAVVMICSAVPFLALVPASAQYPSPDTSLESPRWWPLADGVTPHDLYLASQPEGIAEAYREAVAEGLLPDCGPDFVPAGFTVAAGPSG